MAINKIGFSMPSIARQGFDIDVELEPWRIKELILKLWDKFPDEFESAINSENCSLVQRPTAS